MNRHQTREKAMICLYQSLLLKRDIKSVVYDNTNGSNQIDPFLYTITIDAYDNLDYYIQLINQNLNKSWTFDRLGYVEQAILIMACSELTFKTAQKPIVIDEAVILAKTYCDEDAYKLINGVLDKL